MDVERTDNFLPIRNFSEEVKKITIMKTALRAFIADHERSLLAVQKQLKDGKRQIELCGQEINSLALKINAVETKITESVLANEAAEEETLNTLRENRSIKRKIIDLKHDMDEQEKLLNRANETMNAVRNNCVKNKKFKELPTLPT